MAKFKIQKGLSDADMFKNVKEEETFETAMLKGGSGCPSSGTVKKVAGKQSGSLLS